MAQPSPYLMCHSFFSGDSLFAPRTCALKFRKLKSTDTPRAYRLIIVAYLLVGLALGNVENPDKVGGDSVQ